MASLNIGIIGVGGAGRAHGRRFRKNKHVNNVRGFDIKQINCSHIDLVYDFDEFIDSVDAVSICTPDDSHYEYIVRCIERGKHVLVEKPMVASLSEAVSLEKTLIKYPYLTFAVHHQMRYVPAFSYARSLISKDELGDVFYIEANYWHDMRERNTQFDDWRIRGKGQSVIYGGACHPLDLILHLIEDEVVSHHTMLNKKAYIEYPQEYTSATSTLMFANGIVAKCHTNNCVVFPQMNDLIILGDKASYIDGVLYKNGLFEARCTNAPKRYLKRILPLSGIGNILTRLVTKLKGFRRNSQTIYDHDYACEVIINNYVSCLLNNDKPLVGYADGCRVIKLCEETEQNGVRAVS